MTYQDVTTKELMAVFISRQVKNGEYVSVGTNLPVPTAGLLLAHLTHAPDMRISVLSYYTNLTFVERFEDLTQVANPSVAKWAEGILPMDTLVNAVRKMDLAFAGGMQIDKYGNLNLIGVGSDFNNLKIRGPGSVGAPTVMGTVRRFIIYTNDHSPRTFVEKCDFRSVVGWDNGGEDARKKLGLVGGGPQWVITPKAIMDFAEGSKRMRLRYLLPPATIDDVVASTGFELVIPDQVQEVEPPTVEEIRVLRERVDVRGLLRR